MICPGCDFENPEGARFCNQCGGTLETLGSGRGETNAPGSRFCNQCGAALADAAAKAQRPGLEAAPDSDAPTSFASGRYQVKRLIGEGAKKRVYLVWDERLDHDVAFALIKTEGLA